jgi:hypothetical protein
MFIEAPCTPWLTPLLQLMSNTTSSKAQGVLMDLCQEIGRAGKGGQV